jgi:two-component system cell cycle response regulator
MDAEDVDGTIRPYRVVVADHTPATRLLMCDILQGSGAFEVVAEATDGEEAVDLATSHQPDLVLLDLFMPTRDGMEAIRRIRAASPGSRIVVFSGGSGQGGGPGIGDRVTASAPDGIVEKREPPEEVIRVVLDACRPAVTASAGPATTPAGGAAPISGRDGPAPTPAGPAAPVSAPNDSPGAATAELSELNEALDRARCDLTEIGAAASHDLKSPLQAILGFAHLLDELYAGALDERAQGFLRTIIDASGRMSGLIDGLAIYCRAIAKPPVAVQISLEGVATEVIRSRDADIAASGASVSFLPLPTVIGDPDQVRTVLSALVSNALSWGRPGPDLASEITISAGRTATGWSVSVRDRGPGIEPGRRERAFSLFGRLPPGAGQLPDQPGPGLGLALSRRLVEGWGGTIWIEENLDDDAQPASPGGFPQQGPPGRGCRVSFTIPDRSGAALNAGAAPAAPRLEPQGTQPTPAPALDRPAAVVPAEPGADGDGADGDGAEGEEAAIPGAAIPEGAIQRGAVQQLLLVEDSDPHADLVAATLAEAPGVPYRLRRVTDLRLARRALAEGHVDCVLLDLSLPDGEGLESLAQMLEMAPGIPVVVLTSRTDEALAVASVQQGAQDYLVKGAIEPRGLARSIRYAIERKTLESQLAQQALHDALTGLPNRTLLLDRLNPGLARSARSGDKLALLYLDLDGFKPINDQFGHEAGDVVLVEVARRLMSVVRPQDTVARIGGDEFAVMCEGFRADAEIQSLAIRMGDAIAQPIPVLGVPGETRSVTASIGIAFASSGEVKSADDLIRSADQAMYRIKRREP